MPCHRCILPVGWLIDVLSFAVGAGRCWQTSIILSRYSSKFSDVIAESVMKSNSSRKVITALTPFLKKKFVMFSQSLPAHVGTSRVQSKYTDVPVALHLRKDRVVGWGRGARSTHAKNQRKRDDRVPLTATHR